MSESHGETEIPFGNDLVAELHAANHGESWFWDYTGSSAFAPLVIALFILLAGIFMLADNQSILGRLLHSNTEYVDLTVVILLFAAAMAVVCARVAHQDVGEERARRHRLCRESCGEMTGSKASHPA